jgi:hypothetical protein
MPAIPMWLLGKHVTNYVITGQVVGSDGSLTDATTTGVQPLAGKWDQIKLTSAPSNEEISASDSPRQHTVILQEGTRIQHTAIMEKVKGAGAGTNDKANPLEWLASTYDVLKTVYTRGGRTCTLYFVRGEYDETIVKGKSIHSLNGEPCDPGTTNPAFS